MSEDMLSDVRKKLIQEHKNALVRVPKRLTETYGKTGEFLGMFTGASAGAIWGSSIGIALGGTAIAGTLPLFIVGGIVGYFGGEKIGQNFKK